MIRSEYLSARPLPDIVAFSHLRWEFVTQRPQHLLMRMAQYSRVLFVEEPIGFDDNNRNPIRRFQPHDNITVLQPRISWEHMTDELAPLVTSEMRALNMKDALLWFYSPAFHEMTEHIPHVMLVYDCMDELSGFKGASPLLVAQEQALMKKADLVFTGGKSLYDAKSKFHSNVRCYPSAVDKKHFQQAMFEQTIVPDDIARIPKPIVGYTGVVDERIDLELLRDAALRAPDVSFVMIGPVVKIDEHELPRLPNIHYLGMKPYDMLPAYLKAFDVTMMPFAKNDATRYISPTKTLEYFAAMKPVVSTPIADVVRDYNDVVAIADTAEKFANAVRRFIAEPKQETEARAKRYNDILKTRSWDATAENMIRDIQACLNRKNSKQSVEPKLTAAPHENV